MAVAWPGTLPDRPSRRGYRARRQDNLLKNDTSKGPPLVRRRFTARSQILDVTYEMTTAQKDTFVTFFEDSLLDGEERASIPHPEGGANTEFWVEEPEWTPRGPDLWEVSMVLRSVPS